LFTKNFNVILEKGIELAPLLESDVFNYHYDFDEWPSTHTNDETTIRPYNLSIFNLRQHYLTTFPEEGFARLPDVHDVEGGNTMQAKIDSSKIYKIEYSINLLPNVCSYITNIPDGNGENQKTKVNPDVNVMELLMSS
jgi:hypothetical protein